MLRKNRKKTMKTQKEQLETGKQRNWKRRQTGNWNKEKLDTRETGREKLVNGKRETGYWIKGKMKIRKKLETGRGQAGKKESQKLRKIVTGNWKIMTT